MKRIIPLVVFFSLLASGSFANGQETASKDKPKKTEKKEQLLPLRSVTNNAFGIGEVLEYKVAYGWINAGTAHLEIRESEKKIAGRSIMHMVGTGKSISAFDWFFKVRDRYETYMDEEGMFPWLFVRRIQEGGYKKSQDYEFYQNKGKVRNQKDSVYAVPHGIQDMLSSFYYARTLDFSNAKKGDVFTFDSFVDEKIYPLRIKYIGKKTIKVKKGKYRCMVFQPVIQEGRIFEDDDDLLVYISDDENKIPVLAKAKILVGSIRLELTDYSGLRNPIAEVDD